MVLGNILRKKNTCLYIGRGVIQAVDACIPLKSIADIEVKEVKDTSLIPALVMIVLGVIFYLPGGMWQVIGTIVVVVGILSLIFGVLLNFYRPHCLKIQVHSGKSFLFAGKDLNYVRKSMEIVRDKIDNAQDKEIYYLDFNTLEVSREETMDMVKLFLNNGKGAGIDTEEQDLKEKWKGMFIVRKKQSDYGEIPIPENPMYLYSDVEWKTLEAFFERRCTELGMANEQYKACLSLKECTQEKDARRMNEEIKGMTRTAFQAILGPDVDKSMQKLLLKVMKMK